jgi:hypothetical protein
MALEGRPVIRRGPFTRDQHPRAHTVERNGARPHVNARGRADNRTASVRTDTGHDGHTLKGCVCPVRFVRSHGLAGHHRTLSAMSPLSALSGERESSDAILLSWFPTDRYSLSALDQCFPAERAAEHIAEHDSIHESDQWVTFNRSASGNIQTADATADLAICLDLARDRPGVPPTGGKNPRRPDYSTCGFPTRRRSETFFAIGSPTSRGRVLCDSAAGRGARFASSPVCGCPAARPHGRRFWRRR